MNLIKLIYSRKRCKIETDNLVLFDKVRQALSVDNPSAKYSKWTSDIHCPISVTGYFKFGLCSTVINEFRKIDPLVKIEISPEIQKAMKPIIFKPDEIQEYNSDKFPEREYQTKVIREALLAGRCLFELPTSSGKSLVIYGIVRNLLNKHHEIQTVLVVVPSLQLVKQLYQDFLDYGCTPTLVQPFSSFTGDEEPLVAPIIISNRQWLNGHFDKKTKTQTPGHSEKLPPISAVFVDECQQLSSNNNVTEFINRLPTQVRFGCSGTIPKDLIARWSVIGTIGPVICSIKAHAMQEQKYIADINIVPIRFNHHDRPHWEITSSNFNKMHYLEYDFIENKQAVMDYICRLVLRLPKNSMVLFDHTEHGKKMLSRLQELSQGSHQFRFINGEIPVEEREETRKIMEKHDNVILVANCKAAGVGLSIKNIYNIVFAMSGKAETKVIQACGRGLRLKEGKTKVNLIDFHHNLRYSMNHFRERWQLYKQHYHKDSIPPVKSVNI